MALVTVLITSAFRRSYEAAAKALMELRPRVVAIPMPEEMDGHLRDYVRGRIGLDELLRAYALLTGLSEPFVASLEYRMGPLLEALGGHRFLIDDLKLRGYQSLAFHVSSAELVSELLKLELRAKITGKINCNEWLDVLLKELEVEEAAFKEHVETISEIVADADASAVLYGGFARSIKRELQRHGLDVSVRFTDRYWRPPLEALKALLVVRGPSGVPMEQVEGLLRCHIGYLEMVIRSKDLEEAYGRWIREAGLAKLAPA